MNKRHDNRDENIPNKNFFSNNFIVDVFRFVTAINALLVTTLVIYLLCKHKKLRTLVTSLALQQIEEVGTVTTQEDVNTACTCKSQFYIILALSSSVFSLVSKHNLWVQCCALPYPIVHLLHSLPVHLPCGH